MRGVTVAEVMRPTERAFPFRPIGRTSHGASEPLDLQSKARFTGLLIFLYRERDVPALKAAKQCALGALFHPCPRADQAQKCLRQHRIPLPASRQEPSGMQTDLEDSLHPLHFD